MDESLYSEAAGNWQYGEKLCNKNTENQFIAFQMRQHKFSTNPIKINRLTTDIFYCFSLNFPKENILKYN